MALEVDGLHTYYGESHVLHGVSLRVDPGEVLAILGRNGMGKTTLVRSIVGFTPPRDGRVRYKDTELTALPPYRMVSLGVALVPQGRRVFRSLTVRENLAVAAQTRNQSDKPWTIERVFDLFPRLRERHGQYAGSLSGGEQQMLAIGRGLMGNPRVLLMDEPSEGLAPQIVAEVGRTIAQLKAEGLSIVLVEQNIKLTLDLADDVVIVNTGAVAFTGTAAETKANTAVISQHLGVF